MPQPHRVLLWLVSVLREKTDDLTPDQPTGAVVREGIRGDLGSSAISFNDMAIAMIVSVGVATGLGGDADFETLYALADKALYKGKATGRNRVVAAEPPSRSGGLFNPSDLRRHFESRPPGRVRCGLMSNAGVR